MNSMRAAYDEVYVYTMDRPGFVLQHVVDAFAVQTANNESMPIGLVSGWLAFISMLKNSFRAAKSREYTWSLDAENENGRACLCPRIGGA